MVIQHGHLWFCRSKSGNGYSANEYSHLFMYFSFSLIPAVSMLLRYFKHDVLNTHFSVPQECLPALHSPRMHTNKVCQSEINQSSSVVT